MADNSAFISYRRAPGYPWARLIWEDLGERGVDAFLDLESLRSAGWFDDRLLNQIASRPYFLVVLTAGTLERCASPDDWVRREIEHAIEHDRIIVPVFIAPFEPSAFPADLPEHLRAALSRSQGLTVYSQYLSAAIDKLADELLTPVELSSPDLTDEDERFESELVREIRSLPAPTIPETPMPDATVRLDVPSETPADAPTETPAETDVPAGDAADVPAGDADDSMPTIAPVTEPVRVQLDDDVEPVAPPTEPLPTPAPPAPDDDRRRRMLVGLGVAGAVVLTAGLVAVGVSGGGGDGPTTTVRQLPPGGSTIVTQAPGSGEVYDGVLRADVWLRPGDAVRSSIGDHELVMTEEGRLQLVSGDALIWQPSYSPRDTASAILQRSDGNLVVYADDDAGADVLWASGTTTVGENGSLAVIDDDGSGFVVIEDADGSERWRMPDRGDAARVELDARVDADRDRLDALVDVWVVQLSAKVDGQQENGPWDHERILDEVDDAVAEFEPDVSVVLAEGADFNLNRAHLLDDGRRDFSDWYFTLLLGDFDSRQDGIDWCEANRPGNCGVRLLSADPTRDAQAYFSPSG